MNKLPYKLAVHVVGYQPIGSVLREDYEEYRIGAEYTLLELDAMLGQGVIPPGTILQAVGGVPCIVRGNYYTKQRIEVLQP